MAAPHGLAREEAEAIVAAVPAILAEAEAAAVAHFLGGQLALAWAS